MEEMNYIITNKMQNQKGGLPAIKAVMRFQQQAREIACGETLAFEKTAEALGPLDYEHMRPATVSEVDHLGNIVAQYDLDRISDEEAAAVWAKVKAAAAAGEIAVGCNIANCRVLDYSWNDITNKQFEAEKNRLHYAQKAHAQAAKKATKKPLWQKLFGR